MGKETDMKVLVTGANGFIGKNLVAELVNRGKKQGKQVIVRTEVFDAGVKEQSGRKKQLEKNASTGEDAGIKAADTLLIQYFTHEMSLSALKELVRDCDFVFHLAGINRPKEESEFEEGNAELTRNLLSCLEAEKVAAPVLLSSSTQAELDNPYGRSKKKAEDEVFAYGRRTGIPVYVYRLPNVFGKWSRPNYNTVVATFCYNIARGLPIQVNNARHRLTLAYIDDVVEEFLEKSGPFLFGREGKKEGKNLSEMKESLEGSRNLSEMKENSEESERLSETVEKPRYHSIPVTHEVSLGCLAEIISSFPKMRENLELPDMGDALTRKLYSMYLSYLPEDAFSYPLTMHEDARGSFTEFIRTPERGQVSVNISKPGITKGNHWHHSKNEKFLVVKGTGVIRFRKVGEEKVIEYPVSGERLEVVDIPTGYTHSITNVGEDDMVTVMWANESFDPERPDTFYEEV